MVHFSENDDQFCRDMEVFSTAFHTTKARVNIKKPQKLKVELKYFDHNITSLVFRILEDQIKSFKHMQRLCKET